jgi:hypothetical protein
MQALQPRTKVEYRITPTADGVHLCVWEVVHADVVREQPFLFKANYRVASRAEAEEILTVYFGKS